MSAEDRFAGNLGCECCRWGRRGVRLLALLLGLAAAGPWANGQDFSESSATAPGAVALPEKAAAAEILHRPPASDVVSYWYGATYRTPFVLKPGTTQAADIERNAIEYTHVNFWRLGSNFADVTLSKSGMVEPASGGGSGALEAYVILRSAIGLNEVTGTRLFRMGPVRDVLVELGANLETKNSAFAPAERTIYVGPKVEFAVPRGYFNVGFHFRKEWNHEGVLGKAENYDPGFNVEPAWMVPFAIGKAHLAYTGFAEYNTAKGTDSFGKKTVPEFLLRNYVALDLGALIFHRAQLVEVNGGFWYWHNEYGKPASDPGAKQMTPIVGLTFHLNGGRAMDRR